MNDVMVLLFAEPNIFLSKASYDTGARVRQDLGFERPFVLVCRGHAYAAYLSERFFKHSPTRLYVNIDQRMATPIVSIFIHARVHPPQILDERGRYFLHGVAHQFSLPENNRVCDALYGVTFHVTPDAVDEMLAMHANTGHFQATLGIWQVPGEVVLTQEDAPFAEARTYTTEAHVDFLRRIVSDARAPW